MENIQTPYLGDQQKIQVRRKIREILEKRKDPNYVKAYLYEVEGLDMDTINTEVDSILTLSGQQPTTQPTQKPGMVNIGGQQMELKTMSDIKAYNEMKQAEESKKEQVDSALSSFTEKLGFAEDILADTQGLKSTAGAVQFQLPWSKTKQRFIGNVEGLLDVESIDALIEAKKQGATFGALTDRELQMLRSTASKIGKWAVTDSETDKVIGYDIDEETLQKELTRLRDGFQTAKEKIEKAQLQESQLQESLQPTSQIGMQEDDYTQAQRWLQENPEDPRAERVRQKLATMEPAQEPVQALETTEPDIVEEETGLLEGIGGSIGKRFSNIFKIVKGERISTGEVLNSTIGEKALQTIGQLAALPFDVLNEGLKAGYNTLPEGAREGLESGLKAVAETEGGQAGLQALGKGVEVYQEWANNNPREAQNLEAVVNIASVLPIGAGAKVGVRAGETAVKPLMEIAEQGIKGSVKSLERAGTGIGKGALKIVGDIAEKTPNIGKYGVSQATGFAPETIETIIKTPGAFTKEEMSKISRESVFGKVNERVTKMMDDLSDTGKAYDPIRTSGEYVTIDKKFIPEMLEKYGFKVINGKIASTTKSLTREKSDISALQNFMDNWGDKTVLEADEFLNMRKDLTELAKFGSISGKTGASETIAKGIRNELNTRYRQEIPGLEELDNQFSSRIEELGKVKSIIFDKQGNIKSNAISTIANLTGKGKEQQLKELKKIIPDIEEQVNILKAIQDIEATQGQKVGTYLRGTAGMAGGFGVGGPVGALVGAIVTSPTVALEILKAYGRMKNLRMTDSIISKMKAGTQLVAKEQKIVQEAFEDAVDNIENRIKTNDLKGKGEILPTTQSKQAKDPLIEEARKYKSAEEFVKAQEENVFKRIDSQFKSKVFKPELKNEEKISLYSWQGSIKRDFPEFYNFDFYQYADTTSELNTKHIFSKMKEAILEKESEYDLLKNKKTQKAISLYDEITKQKKSIQSLIGKEKELQMKLDYISNSELEEGIKERKSILEDEYSETLKKQKIEYVNKLHEKYPTIKDELKSEGKYDAFFQRNMDEKSAYSKIETKSKKSSSSLIGYSEKEKEVYRRIYEAWEANNLTEKGYREKPAFTQRMYEIKNKKIQSALETLSSIKTDKIRAFDDYNKGIFYFEIEGKQVSFHAPWKKEFKEKFSALRKVDEYQWVGIRSEVNPLDMSMYDYINYFGASDIKAKQTLIDIWNKAHKK
jgi:hypothetical protein